MNTRSRTRSPRRQLWFASILAAAALLLGACGDDGAATDPATTDPPATSEAPADGDATDDTSDEMTDDTTDEMTDEMDPALEGIVGELTAAGLTEDAAWCVADGAAAEWGADALLAEGRASDDQLLRIAEITFECHG